VDDGASTVVKPGHTRASKFGCASVARLFVGLHNSIAGHVCASVPGRGNACELLMHELL